MDCKAIGPATKCFCGYRYRDHAWDKYADTKTMTCKVAGSPCEMFSYIPVKGAQDLKCSACGKSYMDHHPGSKSCDGRKRSRGGIYVFNTGFNTGFDVFCYFYA